MYVGQLCRFIVNTVNAGSGALAVTIDGPSKVQLSCREIDEGYEFTYSPSAPGDYLITIKYAGSTHIPGSPFKAHIEGTVTSEYFVRFYLIAAGWICTILINMFVQVNRLHMH